MNVSDVNKDFDKIIVVDPGKNTVEAISFKMKSMLPVALSILMYSFL